MTHLIKTANFLMTPSAIRSQVCEVIADIIDTSANHSLAQHLEKDEGIQKRLLIALNQCINVGSTTAAGDLTSRGFIEVQRTGLETLNKLLLNAGHSFTFGWSMIFDMIKSVCVIAPPGFDDVASTGTTTDDD